MKLWLILILALTFHFSCGQGGSATTQPRDSGHIQDALIPVRVRQLRKPPFKTYDFILHLGKVISPTSGIGDGKNQFLVFDEAAAEWTSRAINLEPVRWQDVRAATNRDDQFWLVTESGRVIRGRWSEDRWEIVARVSVADPRFIGVAGSETLYLVGDILNADAVGCEIFKAVDGGKTWRRVFASDVSGNASDMVVIDDDNILVAINDEYLLRSTNGGSAWTPVSFGTATSDLRELARSDETGAKALTMAPNGSVWLVGEKGSVRFSDDKGLTWRVPEEIPISLTAKSELTSIAFSRSGKGVIVGTGGLVLVTDDWGRSWTDVSEDFRGANAADNFARVRARDESFILLGAGGIYSLTF
ncbi:MAG: hypothetical protein IPK58_05345 [Acidobacteria bacterium]|nr:hypothetical protein [Acidobacteriota bacterium]